MRTLWTLFAAWLLLCAGQLATAQDRIFVTEDANGLLVFQRLSTNSDGLLVGVQVPGSEITFIDMTGRGPDDPTDPPPTPGNARLRKLEQDVRDIASAANDPGTANAIGVVFAKVANGVRVGTVSGGTLQSSLTQALDLMLSGRPAWNGLKPIAVSALDNLRSEVGANPSPEAYALTIDAFVRGLGDAGAIRDMAATITPGVDESTLLMAMQATAPAIDWALWLPIILAILKLIFPGLGF